MQLRKYYEATERNSWQGRVDDLEDEDAFRWHQVVECVDLVEVEVKEGQAGRGGFCLLGFCCDEGVERNKGRRGAAKGPLSIRKELGNLPVYYDRGLRMVDGGNIYCLDGDMESAQQALAEAVEKVFALGLFPLLLGGGHEIAFGHFQGILSGRPYWSSSMDAEIGIINFDAHFDLRPYELNGGSSGSPFLQVADYCLEAGREFDYFCLGIQQSGNTRSLFNTAERLGVRYIMARDMNDKTVKGVIKELNRFMRGHEYLYMSICGDVFSAADAPGVSAPQPLGLHPELVLILIKHIIKSGKVVSLDIAEVSPRFDDDNRTAKLAAILLFAIVNTLSGLPGGFLKNSR